MSNPTPNPTKAELVECLRRLQPLIRRMAEAAEYFNVIHRHGALPTIGNIRRLRTLGSDLRTALKEFPEV